MKMFFAAVLVVASTSVPALAASPGDVLLRERCTLSDLEQSTGPTNANKVLDLRAGDRVPFAVYQGIQYEISLFDNTPSSAANPRFEFLISARDIAKKTVYSASSTYGFEKPEVVLQVGADIILLCSPEE